MKLKINNHPLIPNIAEVKEQIELQKKFMKQEDINPSDAMKKAKQKIEEKKKPIKKKSK